LVEVFLNPWKWRLKYYFVFHSR